MKELKYFSATWCQPCKMMKPIVNQTAKEYNIPITYIDIEEDRDAVNNFSITSVPTFILMEDGREVKRLAGARPPSIVREFCR
jgi:thiol-disulfide isomerase/thioredoxin